MITKDTSFTSLKCLLEAPIYHSVEDVDRIVVEWINTRRKTLTRYYRQSSSLPVIDSYHGEMGFPLHPKAADAVTETMRALVDCKHSLSEPNGTLYSKEQPAILQKLSAERLFDRFYTTPPLDGFPALKVNPKDVVVIPYSALAMFEAVMGALATELPGGVVLCPAGFYKEYHEHIQKFGLRLEQFDTDLWHNCKIDPEIMRVAILQVRARGDEVAAIGLTIPGNPLIAEYTPDELRALCKVFMQEDVRVVVDASFDKIVPPFTPLGAVVVEVNGEQRCLYDRVMTITGVSKSFMAFGPLKIGVACCGDRAWLDAVKAQATLTFQRETTALAATVLETTPLEYVDNANMDFVEKLAAALDLIERENASRARAVIQVVGEAKYGPFLTVTLTAPILEKAGIERGHQLSEMVIAESGVDNVSGDRVGFRYPCIRLNVHCPRTTAKKDASLTRPLLERLFDMADRIEGGELTYESCIASLPIELRKCLMVRRFAVVGVDGARWSAEQSWPKNPPFEQWQLVRLRRAIESIGDMDTVKRTYASCWSDLAKGVHAVIMSTEEAISHLEQWLKECKVGCVVIIEDLSVFDEMNIKTQERAKRRGVQFISFTVMARQLRDVAEHGMLRDM